jgi:hypothetical protein
MSKYIYILIILIPSLILSQCISVKEIPTQPNEIRGFGSSSLAVQTQINLRSFGYFNLTFGADSITGGILPIGALVPIIIRDSLDNILADFDFVVGNNLTNVLNDVDNNWVNNFAPYITSDPIITGVGLQSGVTVQFEKSSWARNNGYFYLDGMNILGEWQSGATFLDITVIDSTYRVLRVVDIFSSLASSDTNPVTESNTNYFGSYLPDTIGLVRNNIPIPLSGGNQLTRLYRHAGGMTGDGIGLPDTVYAMFATGWEGLHIQNGLPFTHTLNTPISYTAHLESDPTIGYTWGIRHTDFAALGTGVITINDGHNIINPPPYTAGDEIFTGVTPSLLLGQNYDFYFSTQGATPPNSITEISYKYEINYAF